PGIMSPAKLTLGGAHCVMACRLVSASSSYHRVSHAGVCPRDPSSLQGLSPVQLRRGRVDSHHPSLRGAAPLSTPRQGNNEARRANVYESADEA
ncbi:MAG: hypothetical protein Q4A24_08655, partial [Akkermansia sp.]|nr:hypothetical protein [Akkermansia sp.]